MQDLLSSAFLTFTSLEVLSLYESKNRMATKKHTSIQELTLAGFALDSLREAVIWIAFDGPIL
jgi:hypothetical protein